MSYLRKLVSGLLVLCMVLSMVPAVSADEAEPRDGRIMLNCLSLSADSTVWVDGVAYGVQESGGSFYLDLPQDADPESLITYSYHVGDPEDIHTQYPLSMNVWTLEENTDGSYTPVSVPELENILQYSGSSIRITGVKGIRMITSVDRSKKAALTSEEGLQGYKLLEYGTAVAWASALADGSPMILGRDYVKSNYAFKAGEEDPVFKIEGNMQQYTNVLVNFTLDECAEDIAMRPYMILQTPSGEQMTVYGGIVTRSIGYIAWQNRDAFPKGSAAYNYVWEIIRSVYAEVSFQTNGGTSVSSIFVKRGSSLAENLTSPEKDGYHFAGWYTSPDFTEKFDISSTIDQDMTLYANWATDEVCTVVYNLRVDGLVKSHMADQYAEQSVFKGDILTRPADPEPILGTFLGWYTSPECDTEFDFSKPITQDTVIFANWSFDTTDSDGDTLPDDVEAYLGLDSNSTDTDGDGLQDRRELEIGTDPLKPDTDNDGISDYAEDADSDTLTNGTECLIGTSPIYADSDFDGLMDNKEVNIYGTSPINQDTDSDGADDGWEIANGFDPRSYNDSFSVSISSEKVSDANPVSATVEVSLGGEQIDSLSVQRITAAENPLVSASIPGYLGVAYDFSVDGTFDSAVMTFQYDTSLGTLGSEFQPRIYYVNESSGTLDELPNQIVTDGYVSATVTHFSTYILLNKTAFDIVWETEIKAPIVSDDGMISNIDVAFVIDCSGSMSSNRRLTTAKAALHTFIAALGEKDRAALIKFNTTATVLSELTVDKQYVDGQVNAITAGGSTSMYTGFQAALNMLSDPEANYGYKMIIILSDGEDVPSTSYSRKYAPLVELAKENGIVVYTIGAGTSVSTSILTQVANNTGGAYYSATLTDNILDAFDEIKQETIDVTTDSNNDLIPDYYNNLIASGDMVLSNGSNEYVGIDFNYDENGNLSADYDGDGLLNGEELVLITRNNRVYLDKKSDPMMLHSDNDGIDDYEETMNNTDPLRAPQYDVSAVSQLQSDKNYFYEGFVDDVYDDSFIFQMDSAFLATIFGVWNVEELFRDIMIDFFAEHVPSMTQQINDEASAMLVSNIDGLISKASKVKGVIDDARYYWKFISNLKNLVSVINGHTTTIEYAAIEYMKYVEQLAVYDPSAGTFIVSTYKMKSTTFSLVTSQSELKNGSINGVSVALNLFGGVIDIADTVTSLAAVNANSQIFQENMDILLELKNNGSRAYARSAAALIAEQLAGEYGNAIAHAVGGDIGELTLNIAITIATVNPYVKAIKFVRDSIAMITGIKDTLKAEYQMLTYNCMAYSVNRLINQSKTTNGYSCYYGSDALSRYLTNLAVIRILGEKKYEEYYSKGMIGWFTDDEEVHQMVESSIYLIESAARLLNLTVNANP